MKFGFVLIMVGLVFWALLFLAVANLTFAYDMPRYDGFPLIYKIEGCNFACGVINNEPAIIYAFYPIGLLVDILFPFLVAWAGYHIGNKFIDSSGGKKVLVAVFFIVGMLVVSVIISLLYHLMPAPQMVPKSSINRFPIFG